ncbi:MAG: RecBCD enzyme subunit RecB [bacterium]|nr:RecBCD enzyme subunit RecB [bacterium]
MIPPDQTQRERILGDLDTTLLVEAAAGTGKTTCMVGRMLALIAKGKCGIDNLAAVTFTRKAAAELRMRFQSELRKAAEQAADSASRERFGEALMHLDQCFIGTIHSFCARLLRERPVEAEVDFVFEELDDDTDQEFRARAWREALAEWGASDNQVLGELLMLGLAPSALEEPFAQFAEYPDVAEWPVTSNPSFSVTEVVQALEEYVAHMRELLSILPSDPGTDKLILQFRLLVRMARQSDLSDEAQLFRILEQFKPISSSFKVTQKVWPGKKEQALAEQDRWTEFHAKHAAPFVRYFRGKRHAAVIRAFQAAQVHYDRLRQASSRLNFQDLLLRAARLLRERPNVRRFFQRRYTHLLVDEFQDTDPIQAEVMLLLASEDMGVTDWRRCIPRPGSLFVVGDPKQSIYRFRRADIVTYNDVKRIIETTGGAVATLSANFRTERGIIEWVNNLFAPHFPLQATPQSPVYVPLAPGRTEALAGDLSGVLVLDLPADQTTGENLVKAEAERIAAFIRSALDNGWKVPRSRREVESGAPSEAQAGDFLIVTRGRKHLSAYAEALRRHGVPHEVTGGSALNDVEELRLLYIVLASAWRPDDPVALVGALRSELFGISDSDLYLFHRMGGIFDFRSGVPQGLDGELRREIAEAFGRLNQYARWLRELPPAPCLERILEDLGLSARAAAHPGGNERAGGLLKAVELIRSAQGAILSTGDLLEKLGRLVDRVDLQDSLPASPSRARVVRVMNLHKVKGLEAPVVFLADPTGGGKDHPVEIHVDRAGDRTRGYLAVFSPPNRFGGKGSILAHPEDWERIENLEKSFLKAEEIRLLYVAATRAGGCLVITRRAKRPEENPWNFFSEVLGDAPPLPEASLSPRGPMDGGPFIRERSRRPRRISRSAGGRFLSRVTGSGRQSRLRRSRDLKRRLRASMAWSGENCCIISSSARCAIRRRTFAPKRSN